MPVGYRQLPPLSEIPGIRLAAVAAGIRYQGRDDLVVMELAAGSRAAAVFTRNAFCAAPVVVAREHLHRAMPRYLLINSGNANAGTGEAGLAAARDCCQALAGLAGCDAAQVLPFSTGVIGQQLPLERVRSALPAALSALSASAWAPVAEAIKTTDTVAKGVSRQLQIDGRSVTVTGIAKGAGMIRPDMATMLAYLATDAKVEAESLRACLQAAVARSFNRITVDGDTSTNDACVLVATGAAGGAEVSRAHPDYPALCEVVAQVCERLAELIVRDAEGATKFVTVEVSGGADSRECLQVAYAVAQSPLVKTALFASDPNWGRILAAVGRAGLQDLDVSRVEIFLDEVCIVHRGGVAPEYREADGQRVMDQEEIRIDIRLGRGSARERVWTSDLSHDYVRINAEYRS